MLRFKILPLFALLLTACPYEGQEWPPILADTSTGDDAEFAPAAGVNCSEQEILVEGMCLGDSDGDGVPQWDAQANPMDNCPEIPNPDQADSDGDRVGDACESIRQFLFDWNGRIAYTQYHHRRRQVRNDLQEWAEKIYFLVRCYDPQLRFVSELETQHFDPQVQDFSFIVEYNQNLVDVCVISFMTIGERPEVPPPVGGPPPDAGSTTVVYGEATYTMLDSGRTYDAVHELPVGPSRQYFIDLSDGHQHAPEALPPLED